jgi:nicotinamide riboside transporter PnuC
MSIVNNKIQKIFNLKTISWIASSFSLIGIFLNALKLIWCWPVWIIGNLFWIYWAWRKQEWAQVILWAVFELANIFGWYSWAIM